MQLTKPFFPLQRSPRKLNKSFLMKYIYKNALKTRIPGIENNLIEVILIRISCSYQKTERTIT